MSKKNELDQYYTSPEYAEVCYNIAKSFVDDKKLFVEPCAGAGAFFNLMPEDNRLGMDLDPKLSSKGFIPTPQDFLLYDKPFIGANVISNPPFGRNATLAVQFFNKCAELGADLIAFVIPRTFRKASVINKLDRSFELVFDEVSPKNSFVLEGEAYDVPCCFQVWKKVQGKERELIETSHENNFFTFCEKEVADFAVRRAGGKSGKLLEGVDHSTESTYFLQSKIDLHLLEECLKNIDLSEESQNTAGVRCIAKYELSNKVKEYFNA